MMPKLHAPRTGAQNQNHAPDRGRKLANHAPARGALHRRAEATSPAQAPHHLTVLGFLGTLTKCARTKSSKTQKTVIPLRLSTSPRGVASTAARPDPTTAYRAVPTAASK